MAAFAIFGWVMTSGAVVSEKLYDPHALSEVRGEPYPFTVEVFGYKYRGKTGDYVDDHILAYGAYEKDILFFMGDYVRALNDPNAVFVDVGASEGQHSLFMSRRVKEVHAFEPYPPAAERFKRQVEFNGFTNIRLHEVGLGEKEATIPFYAPENTNIGTGTFLRDHEQGEDRTVGSFRVVAGDEWLGPLGLKSVAVVKVDVEGYEKQVLLGLAKTLKAQRPVLVIEVTHPPRGSIDSVSGLKALLPEGYDCLRFEGGRERAVSGKYRLVSMNGFEWGSLYEMVVAFPKERAKLVPREGAGKH
jgi:FkbM family methyltransferase